MTNINTPVTGLEEKDTRRFISVLGSEGDLRETVSEGTEGSVRREYETSKGEKGVKWEKVYKRLGGVISDVQLWDGDFGTNLQLTVKIGEDDFVTLSLGTNTPYGEDVMKKLPNINMNEHVVFTPYAFIDDHGKNRRGMTITQGDTKIQSFFNDPEAKKTINGMPEPKGDTEKYTKEKWTLYFATVRDFLVDYTKDNILPQFGHNQVLNADGSF